MTTRDEVREVLRTLPDDYLRRYVNAYETRQLSCFDGVLHCECAVTAMAGVQYYDVVRNYGNVTIESFYEGYGRDDAVGGPNATPLYDECVLELARRAEPVPAAVGV